MIRQIQVSRFVGAVRYTAAFTAVIVALAPSSGQAQSLSPPARADSLLAAANAQLTLQPKQKAIAAKQAQVKSATTKQAAGRSVANGNPRAAVGPVPPAPAPVTPTPDMRRRPKH
jgi:hypothetical protein